MFRALFRCLPGLSTIALLILIGFAFFDLDSRLPLKAHVSHGSVHKHWKAEHGELKLSQKIFVLYFLITHIDTAGFSLRLCLALVLVRRKIKETLKRRQIPLPDAFEQDGSPLLKHRRGNSPPPPYTSAPPSPSLNELSPHSEVKHAIIIPNYSECLETLQTTLKNLASHPRARTQYEIYLAMEKKEAGSEAKAATLISAFEDEFAEIRATFHPSDIPGEIAGKSSNVSFAARQIFRDHQESADKLDVIITVIDSDTHLLQDYFTELRRLHHRHPNSSCALYVCPIIFDRNAHETNVLVRVADILWGAAGLSGFLPWSTILIPTSVYSLPLALAEQVGGWDGDPVAIGEDMHMLLKTYFNSHGKLATIPVYSAASQCNISAGECDEWSRGLRTIQARYRQAQRHMWGCLDSGYTARRIVELKSFRLSHIPLLHLLWEAHILPSHFILMLLTQLVYTSRTPTSKIHPELLWAFATCTTIRNASFFVMQVALTLYDGYHHLCVTTRAQDMQVAGIEETFAWRQPWKAKYLAERILFPIAGAIYSAAPAIYAQVFHFWTDRLVYSVSLKPIRALSGTSRSAEGLV
ncbi:uncharacterized protein PV09_05027 [Verruconis gallopava]|uniref:Glycosyltransferase 2-like domain-containing protein n=1 Tax=Verruconis gallopava TaxID=253628 RepID=A0A0D2AAC1_9PEZI|nr:uncharacterized protein PV09_05027 [Verruconis gallopava]KIW03718.1 hypothetical protein PV09_05027 [Verruconis gallopava]